MARSRSSAGFSLVELLVVIAILGIVTAHILGIFSSQLQTYVGQKAVVEVQDDARLSSDLIFHDLRMAGYMMPQGAALSGLDGGTSGADTLCVSDPGVLDDTQVDLATDRFPGASLSANLGGSAGSTTLTVADLDVDGDGDVDFAVGSGIIIAEGSDNHCARITSVSPGTGAIGFVPDTPSGFAANMPNAVAVPAVIYEWSGGSGLTRNNLVVSRQVEDLQVEFGVDTNADGQLSGGEFPIHGLYASNPAQVRLVRLSVLTRTSSEDPNLSGPGRQAVANRTAAGSSDAYRRRLVTVSAAPRNLM